MSLNDKEIADLYIKKCLSSRQIAKIYRCSKSTICSHLKKNNIELRDYRESKKLRPNPEKYQITSTELSILYHDKKMSTYQIAKTLGCSPSAIFGKLKKYRIPRRSLSESVTITNSIRLPKIAISNIKYCKQPYDNSFENKAYLIGFRLGDLHVTKNPNGVTIIVACWSTKIEQISLIYNLFIRYGHINIIKRVINGRENFGITCNLDTSFTFLINKEDSIPRWIFNNYNYFSSFAAGYIDAEGNFNVYKSHGRLTIRSYQKNILKQMSRKLNEYGINCPKPYISVYGGHIDKRGVITRQDTWTLRVNKKSSMVNFMNQIGPYMKHTKRLKDANKVYQTL